MVSLSASKNSIQFDHSSDRLAAHYGGGIIASASRTNEDAA